MGLLQAQISFHVTKRSELFQRTMRTAWFSVSLRLGQGGVLGVGAEREIHGPS